ncbi:MAG: PD40 domain-containing protein, partial [Acidobacteria bacterium]|nr:PD40 domain-containing protein [Acidobacteriota bacterium]
RSKPPETPTIRYLTYSGHDRSPAASPDGRTVAFCSDRDGRPRIWLKDLASGSEVALTEGPDDFPRFSPDGSMVLFTRGVDPFHASLYRVATLGGEPRKLVDDVLRSSDWSPDGRQVAFVRNFGTSQAIGVVGANGEGQREVIRVDSFPRHPRWSPDGRFIAAVQQGEGFRMTIFLVGADGKGARSLPWAPGGFEMSSPAWTGAEEVVYSQSESVGQAAVPGGTARIIRQSIASGAGQMLFPSPHNSAVLDVIGRGRVVFDAISNRQNLREFPLQGKTVSPQYRWLAQGSSQDRQPVYSPGGEWVLFTSNRSGNLDLWEMSTKTGALRRITDDPADDWDPAFTPDGKKIIWSSNRSGHFEIWMADADGSNARQVTSDGVDAEHPTMTRDGQWTVYDSGNAAKGGLWKIHPDGSGATRLVAKAFVAEVSPDGLCAVYGIPDGALRVVRTADGADMGFAAPNGRPRWMPDGHAVAFTGPDEKGVRGIFVQDFIPGQDTSKTRRKLGGFDPQMETESFGISPDGTRITISSRESLNNLMLAERVPGIAPPARKAQH